MKKAQTEKEKISWDENLLTWLAREVCSDDYQKSRRNVEQGLHPTDEMLYKYVWEELDKQDVRIIKAHIAFCGSCAEEVLRLRLVEEKLEERVLSWVDEEEESVTLPYPRPRGDYPPLPLQGGELFEGIATEYWEPQWMGQYATAADIPRQEHVFKRDDGDIMISCFWRGKYRKKPAYISISWEADVTTRNEFCARFVNPETHEQIAEVCLGTCLAGEEIFTSEELGFDPSCERWAMALVIRGTTS